MKDTTWTSRVENCKVWDKNTPDRIKSRLDITEEKINKLKDIAINSTQNETVGGGFGMRGHMYTRDWFMTMYDKNHHNILISLQLK